MRVPKERSRFNSIRKIDDIIEYNIIFQECYITLLLTIDFEKPFDSINRKNLF